MERSANQRRRAAPNLVVGQKVWLLRRHISTTRPLAKLDVRRLGVNFSTLTPGPEFVTAKGKVVVAMGTTPQPLEFVLSSGTPQKLTVHLHAIIVDINAYCAILGMEFISAIKGG